MVQNATQTTSSPTESHLAYDKESQTERQISNLVNTQPNRPNYTEVPLVDTQNMSRPSFGERPVQVVSTHDNISKNQGFNVANSTQLKQQNNEQKTLNTNIPLLVLSTENDRDQSNTKEKQTDELKNVTEGSKTLLKPINSHQDNRSPRITAQFTTSKPNTKDTRQTQQRKTNNGRPTPRDRLMRKPAVSQNGQTGEETTMTSYPGMRQRKDFAQSLRSQYPQSVYPTAEFPLDTLGFPLCRIPSCSYPSDEFP